MTNKNYMFFNLPVMRRMLSGLALMSVAMIMGCSLNPEYPPVPDAQVNVDVDYGRFDNISQRDQPNLYYDQNEEEIYIEGSWETRVFPWSRYGSYGNSQEGVQNGKCHLDQENLWQV